MTSKRWKRLWSILSIIFVNLLYFFIFVPRLGIELAVSPRWKTNINAETTYNTNLTKYIGYATSNRYGYFGPNGDIAFLADAPNKIQFSDNSYILKESTPDGSSVTLKSAKNTAIAVLQASSPFYNKGKIFSVDADGTCLSAYNDLGNKLWSYIFPCHLSSFASSNNIIAGGTVDGWIEGVDITGQHVFSFAPGGSRLPVIVGLDISKSGDYIAAISGIDKQRLVVLNKGNNNYRVVSHCYLENSYREPVQIVILDDEKHVLYRRPDGLGLWSVDGKINEVLPIKAETFTVALNAERNIAFLVAKYRNKQELVVFRIPATILGRIALPDNTEYFNFELPSVYIGSSDWIAALDFVEK